ncbi:hypothetical protein [Nocardiopsis coralliicola]
MSLGDAFNRRKKLAADLASWTNRLQLAGAERRSYRTPAVSGSDAYVPEAGSEKATRRNYTVAECRERIGAILAEDEELALRISRTNQRARADVEGLDGQMRRLSVPELLVLKDDIIPKLEQAARSVPLSSENAAPYETGDGWIRYRSVRRVERKKESFNEHGLKIEEQELLGFDVVETTDYGVDRRGQWDEIDRIAEFAQRVKQAVNRANKTELVELD